nr:hypothetical protein [Tanacetum cinerariifolium]
MVMPPTPLPPRHNAGGGATIPRALRKFHFYAKNIIVDTKDVFIIFFAQFLNINPRSGVSFSWVVCRFHDDCHEGSGICHCTFFFRVTSSTGSHGWRQLVDTKRPCTKKEDTVSLTVGADPMIGLRREDDFEIVKVRDHVAYGKKVGFDVRRGGEYKAIGDDDRLVGLFWADEEAITNYDTFGDIVSFDATFHSNKYQMVFVSFTGINHHNRCITFASGLLADETAGAYIWLLKQFKEAFRKDPEVVVTDQDPSMKIAIAECFPDTRHRLCMWHIMTKLERRERKCMINDFELGENKWFGDMFDLRKSLIHAYLTDVHMAGLMCTTSRSESENHFLVEFCKSEMKLHCSLQSEVLELYKIFESSIVRLVHDLDKLHIYKDKMKELLNQAEIDVPTVPKVNNKAVMSAMLGVDEPEKVLIGNPNLRKVKGTGYFSRMKPLAEEIAEELPKKRTCGLCGGKEGHNKRTCTNELASKKPKVQAAPKEKATPKQQASQPRRSGLRSSTPK